jgi:hypothetical protein
MLDMVLCLFFYLISSVHFVYLYTSTLVICMSFSAVSDVLLDATNVLGGESTLKVLSSKLAQVNLAICSFISEISSESRW